MSARCSIRLSSSVFLTRSCSSSRLTKLEYLLLNSLKSPENLLCSACTRPSSSAKGIYFAFCEMCFCSVSNSPCKSRTSVMRVRSNSFPPCSSSSSLVCTFVNWARVSCSVLRSNVSRADFSCDAHSPTAAFERGGSSPSEPCAAAAPTVCSGSSSGSGYGRSHVDLWVSVL